MPPSDNGSGERDASGELIFERAEALRSKLNANTTAGEIPPDLEEEMLEFFENVPDDVEFASRVPHLEGVTLQPILDGLEAIVRGFLRNNLLFDFEADVERWSSSQGTTPWDRMRAKVDRAEVGGVRVVGECWGMSELTHPKRKGGLLYTDASSEVPGRVEWVDEVKKDAVRCHLGATRGDVHTFLRNTDKRLLNQPGFSGLTVAGVVGTGGHGSGLRFGPLASLVSRMEVADIAGGGGRTVYGRGDALFETAVTHLGRLGPVLSLDLDVHRKFHIAETRTIETLERDGFAALIDRAIRDQEDEGVHSVEIWVAPYPNGRQYTVAYGRRAFSDAAIAGERPGALRCKLLQKLGHFIANFVAVFHKPWIKGALRMAVARTKTPEPVVMDASDGLDFGAPNGNPMTSMEMAVRLDRGAAAVDRLLGTIQEMTADNLYVFSPVGLRFVGQGAKRGLSPQAGNERTLHLEVPTFKDARLEGATVLEKVQRKLASDDELRGRPHWGQRVGLDKSTLASLWDEESRAELRELIARVDPANVFASPLIDEMLAHRP